MSKIENAKTYLGKELENIFFRPLFADEGARELGIKVMYNMPAPTRLHFWHRPETCSINIRARGGTVRLRRSVTRRRLSFTA